MRRRWLLILTALTALGFCAFWLHETGIVLGWLRGEAFYQGRPTNYWSRELARWQYGFALVDFDGDGGPDMFIVNDGLIGDGVAAAKLFHNNGDGTFTDVDGNGAVVADLDGNGGVVWLDVGLHGGYSRAPGLIDKMASRFGITLESGDSPALLRGDPAAEPVLRELLDDPDPVVREHARRGLDQIRRARR